MEFGVFNDEGMVQGDFATRESAERAMAEHPDFAGAEPGEFWVAEVCHDHEGHEHANCEECASETGDESEEEES
jgi:hypothetical protein